MELMIFEDFTEVLLSPLCKYPCLLFWSPEFLCGFLMSAATTRGSQSLADLQPFQWDGAGCWRHPSLWRTASLCPAGQSSHRQQPGSLFSSLCSHQVKSNFQQTDEVFFICLYHILCVLFFFFLITGFIQISLSRSYSQAWHYWNQFCTLYLFLSDGWR